MSSFIPVHKNPYEILNSSDSPTSATPERRRRRQKNKSPADLKATSFKYKLKAELKDNKENIHVSFVEDATSKKIMHDLEKQLVEITHKVELIDTYITSMIPRHTPMADITEPKTVQSMQNSFGGSVHVSPARSAMSETEVNLHLPFQDLLAQMNNDFNQKFRSLKVELEEKMDTKLAVHLEKQEKWIRVLDRGQGIRNIEDWAIGRMKRELKIQNKTKRSYTQIIDQFVSEFNFSIVKESDLQSLKNSQGRTDANSIFHISLSHNSDEEIDELWKLTKPSLSEKEKGKYERLMQFGRGKTAIQKK